MTNGTRSIEDARRRREPASSGARVPPHNLQAEESLLGAMLLSRDAIASAVEHLDGPEAFYKPAHGHIFEAATALYARADPVDPVTVAEELRRAGLLDTIGGSPVLINLQAGTPAISNAGSYARIVADHAQLRALVGAGAEISELAYSLPEDVPAAIDSAESMLFSLKATRESAQVRSLRDGLGGWLDTLESRVERGGDVEHPTEWHELDELTGGLHASRLMVVAARPGMGKSSWAGALTTNVAGRGEPVLFVSVEMSYEELVGRFVAEAARLDGSRLARGRVAPNDWPWINNAIGRLAELPIEIVDIAGATVLSVRGAARRVASRYGRLGLVVVDYVQLMTGRGRAENRQVEVAEITRGLKLLAKELSVPVVALAQLSRGVELRGDKRPMLSDLRETGELENSADVVVFIYRDEYYKHDSPDRGIAELIVAKNRHGPQGVARVAADLASGQWRNMSRSV